MRWTSIEGDHRAIGIALGELATDAFRNVLPRIARYREVTETWAGTGHLAQLHTAGRARMPHWMDTIEGIAVGAGMPLDAVLAWNCRGDFPGGGDQTALAGCTDVMVHRDDEAQAAMAHNEDDQPELDGHCHMVDITPQRGARFVSFYSPGLLPGHTFGWNANGLVQTINHLRTHDQRIGVPRHLLCAEVLVSASLDAAVGLLNATPRAGGFHHNLGQAGPVPRLVSVEAPPGGTVVTPVRGSAGHANHLVERPFARVAQTITTSSRERHQRAVRLARQAGADLASLRAILSDTEVADWPIRRRRTGGPDTGFTLAAALFELGPAGIRWQIHEDPAAPPVAEGRDLERQGGTA